MPESANETSQADSGRVPCSQEELRAVKLELEEAKGMCQAHHLAAKEAAAWAEATSDECDALRRRLQEVESKLAVHASREAAAQASAAGQSSAGATNTGSAIGSVEEQLRRALSEREAEVAALQATVADLKLAMATSVQGAEKAAEEVAVKVASLSHHLEIINAEVAAERQRALDAEARVVAARKEAAIQAAQANELRGKAMVTEENLKEAEAHSRALYKDLAASRAESSAKESELRDAHARLERTVARCSDLEASNKRLTDRLARKTAELASERSKSASLEATMSTLDSVRNELKIEMLRFQEFQDRKDREGELESIGRAMAWAHQQQHLGPSFEGSPPAFLAATSPDLSAVSASGPDESDGGVGSCERCAKAAVDELLGPEGIDLATVVANKLER